MGYTKTAIKSAAWLGGLKVFKRAVGYVRIAILARILTPAQFGIFGVAILVLAFLETLTETGINIILIQEKQKIEKYISTAWIISILRGLLIFAIILLSAKPTSNFFNSPQAYSLLLIISIIPVLRGLINPSIVKFRKELQFDKESLLNGSLYLAESIVILAIAFFYRTEKAFAFGLITSAIIEVIFSHLFIHPRPKLKLNPKIARKILKSGKWVTLFGIFKFANQQADDAIVGRLLNVGNLGIYQNAYKISTLPLTEISGTITNVNFPVYSKFSSDTKRVRKAFIKTFKFSLLAILPPGIIFFLFPREIVLIILGNQWLPAADILRTLSIFGVLSAINAPPVSVFLALKRQDLVAKQNLIQLATMLATIVPLILKYQIQGAAFSVTISAAVILPITYFHLFTLLKLPDKNK